MKPQSRTPQREKAERIVTGFFQPNTFSWRTIVARIEQALLEERSAAIKRCAELIDVLTRGTEWNDLKQDLLSLLPSPEKTSGKEGEKEP